MPSPHPGILAFALRPQVIECTICLDRRNPERSGCSTDCTTWVIGHLKSLLNRSCSLHAWVSGHPVAPTALTFARPILERDERGS
jgi:hypothetical protein